MSPERTDSRLLEAALDVTSSLDLQRILRRTRVRINRCTLRRIVSSGHLGRYDDVRRVR